MEFADVIRAIVGLVIVLFLPGYAWSRVFFKKDEIDLLERVALSFGLSIAIVPLTVFFLNKLGMKITMLNVLITIIILIFLPIIILRLRK